MALAELQVLTSELELKRCGVDDERTSRQTIERSLQAALQHVDELVTNEKVLQERLETTMSSEQRAQRLNTELETELGQHEGKLLAVQEALEMARARHIVSSPCDPLCVCDALLCRRSSPRPLAKW